MFSSQLVGSEEELVARQAHEKSSKLLHESIASTSLPNSLYGAVRGIIALGIEEIAWNLDALFSYVLPKCEASLSSPSFHETVPRETSNVSQTFGALQVCQYLTPFIARMKKNSY